LISWGKQKRISPLFLHEFSIVTYTLLCSYYL